MSLKIWLPLTKDLRNQGLDNVTVTNNGATFNSVGKLGGCYSFNGSSNYLYTTEQGYFGNNYSFSAWIYTTSTSATQTIGCIRATVGSGFSLFLIGGKLRIDPGGNNIQWTTSYTYPANTWFHLVVTYDGTTVKYYINGEYKQSYTATISSTYWGNTLSFGASQANGSGYGNYLNGRLNDVRVYDHTLSQMEVKELAKGLVLHYPLNRQGWGQENLYVGSHDFSGTWVNGGAWATSSEIYNGFTVRQKSSIWGGITQNIPCTVGDIFTISFYAKVQSGGRITSIHRSSLGNVTTGLNILGGNFVSGTDWVNASDDGTQWKRYWATVRIDSSDITYLQWRVENSIADKMLYVCGMKMEKGEKPTPWCPNSADTLATTMGLNSTIEYDSSGFGNNGTRTGAFAWTSDTPKYNVSAKFTTEPNAISFASNFSHLTTFTYSCWIKTGVSQSAFLLMGYQYGNNTSGSLSLNGTRGGFHYYANAGTYSDVTIEGSVNCCDNQWHMITATYDGSKIIIYIDGIKAAEGTVTLLTTARTFSLNYPSGASGRYFNGLLSDARVYATALSADDVKSLYQNSAYIDNSGNVYGTIHEV